MSGKIYSVGEVTALVRELLDGDERLRSVYIRGEISNYRPASSGHHYFTLKDGDATLKAVMFRREASRLRFKPENGMKVIVMGRISVYAADGVYQLYDLELTPDGIGDLHVAYEQLKAKLQEEGLFDPAHKKPLPPCPGRIALVTSATGAAVRDIIRVAGRRYPLVKLMVLSVRVQGAEAPAEIVSAIRYANRHHLADLIITGRGGGSIEELWAFNDERVARAIYASEIPVISSVGHEPDFTIADFVADVRAATPTHAAELAVPDKAKLLETIQNAEKRMKASILSRLEVEKLHLRRLRERRVLQDPGVYLDDRRIALDHLSERLENAISGVIARKKDAMDHLRRLDVAMQGCIARKRAVFDARTAALDAMSPLKVLSRGYAIAAREDGALVRSSREVSAGDRLRLRLAEGRIICEVLERKDETDGEQTEL